MKKNIPEIFVWEGYSFDPLLHTAMEDIILDFPDILSEIEGTYALYERVRPHAAHLRASVSKQIHFSILPLVAKNLGIPSLELQHGLEYLGPGSWSRNHEAEYIAVYGELTKGELRSIGYEKEKLPVIGSPRFDRNIHLIEEYHQERKKSRPQEKLTILCIAPDIRAFEIYDSYSAADYFTSIARSLEAEKDHVHIVIKLRPGPSQEEVLRLIIEQAFSGFHYRIAHNEPLSQICKNADMAISCFSTALLEALQFEIPVIMPALHPVDAHVTNFHFSPYREAGVVDIVYTSPALAGILSDCVHRPEKLDGMRKKIRAFMTKNFCFDGRSSERYATLMNKLAEGHP